MLLVNIKSLAVIIGIFASVLSTEIQVVRQSDQNPAADVFTNHDCSPSTCPNKSFCANSTCCMCQCEHDFPNFLVNMLKCTSNDELNRMTSSNCRYSLRSANEPLEILPLTDVTNGSKTFANPSVRVDCNAAENVEIKKWQVLEAHGQWIDGEKNVFYLVLKRTGPGGSKKYLKILKWWSAVNARYAGMIIKISVKCSSGTDAGCFLAKIEGTHTYNRSPTTTSSTTTDHTTTSTVPTTTSPTTADHTTTSAVPDTTSPTTADHTTASTVPDTTSPITSAPADRSTGSAKPATSLLPEETTETRFPPVPRTNPLKTTESATLSQNTAKKQAQDTIAPSTKTASANNVGRVVGIIAGVLCLLCLVCLIVVLYRRRKNRLSEKPKKNPAIAFENKMNDYQEPVYDELTTKDAGDFDNPVYCDPDETNLKRRSKQDPLPAVPMSESTYQPLDITTRNVPGPSLPALPPGSYPTVKEALTDDSSDYLNPNREAPSDTKDYDNPQATNENLGNMNGESSDYDNPPTINQNLGDMNNESSNYDNNPLQGSNDNYLQIIDTNQTSPGVESVPDSAPEAEYFELEPEDSSF